MSGHWHSLSVSGQKMQLESVEIDVLSDGEGGAYLWYSGAKNGQCVTTSKAHLSPRHNDSRGEFTVHYSRFSSECLSFQWICLVIRVFKHKVSLT